MALAMPRTGYMNYSQSEILFERAKKTAPGGVHSPVRSFRGVGGIPRFIKSAKGAELTDVDGNTYIDFCMSWGPLIFGHQDEEIMCSVQEALHRGWSYGTAEPWSLELAELITQNIPWVEKIRFVSSGTEAVMSAIRLARAATGRNKILKFDGCYHGHADSMLVRAGSGLAEMTTPDSAGVSKATANESIVAPLNDSVVLEKIFEDMGKEIAAIIVEPIPANNGLLIQTSDFLPHVCKLARMHGALVIFDEVITGFRVAFGGMAERTGLTPDIVTYGKIIGGGFPVGAYGGSADLMDLVAPLGPVYQAGTLSANPVAMCAGIATLKKLKRDNPYIKLEALTMFLASEIEKHTGWHVQNFASIFWIVCGKIETQDGIVRSITQIPSTQKERYAKLFHKCLDHGFYLAPSGHEVSFLSTVHHETNIHTFLEVLK
ncbi:MAG: glutamate-1-semialdehyde 2,1-aminomutase [Deltaproteobacteria bacterium]|nr:glutamate-1-semialdehyde 2,1-aminomutase [Deltaproteobacteria bacterium]